MNPRTVAAGLLLGMAGGVFGGMFGVGGGLVMVPGMVLLMATPQHRAHATSVAAIVAASTAAVVPLALEAQVDWAAAGLVLLGATTGAAAGARLIARVPEVWLARAFVLVVVVSAVRMALAGEDAGPEGIRPALDALTAVAMVAVGLAAGALAAMLGIGGGIVFVPALVTLFGFGQHAAQATSLAVIAPTTAVAAWIHARAGRVDWPRALALGAGGLVGGALGGWSAIQVDGLLLRRLFAGVLVLVAYRMLAGTRRRAATGTAAGSSPG